MNEEPFFGMWDGAFCLITNAPPKSKESVLDDSMGK